MATKKDLVEAYSFSRRRLVTAFISGAPGGREVEPARPGRTVVGGLALAVLLIAGAAIAGIFAPRAPGDWTEPGLILSKEDGSPYVITDGEGDPVLRPVINITSAKLILGPDTELRNVPQDEIDEQIVGDDIGILGAPAKVPSPDLLLPSGWTACTDADEGVRVTVSEEPGVRDDPRGAYVVSNAGRYYVIAVSAQEEDLELRAYSYLLPADGSDRDNILGALDLGTGIDNATEVSDEWLGLFPPGAPLDESSFDLEGVGAAPRDVGGDTGIPDDALVGDVLVDGSDVYLLTRDGPAPLTEFAADVYLNLPTPPTQVEPTGQLGEERAASPFAANHWPTTAPSPIAQQPCAVLHAKEGVAPAVLPGVLLDDAEVPPSSEGVTPGQKSQGVQAGHGAYVLSASFADVDTGHPFLIDPKGVAYPLVGAGAAHQLGYDGAEHPTVPDEWVELFEPGVPLSRDAALCPPSETPGVTC